MAATVLVADDDTDILRFVEINLRLEGFQVVTAQDGPRGTREGRYGPAPPTLACPVPSKEWTWATPSGPLRAIDHRCARAVGSYPEPEIRELANQFRVEATA